MTSILPKSIGNLMRYSRDLSFLLFSFIGILFILVETPRGLMIPDSHRIYNVILGSAFIYLGLRLKFKEVDNRVFIPIFLASFLFPPIIFLSYIPKPKETPEEINQGDNLLGRSFSSNLVVCDSIGLACSISISIAKELSKYRRVVLIDWTGKALSRLESGNVKIAKAGDVWFGYAGNLGPSYHMTVSNLLSYLTNISASVINESLKTGDTSLLEDLRIPEPSRSILLMTLGEKGSLLHEALPETAGILIVDASNLPATGKDIVSLMALLQSVAYENRDFLIIAPLLSPLTDPKLPKTLQDEIRWMISSLSNGGAFIASTKESMPYCDEFDSKMECDGCDNPIGKVDNYQLCPLQVHKGRIRL